MNASFLNEVNINIKIRYRPVGPCDDDRPDFPTRLVRHGNHGLTL